MVCLFKLAYIIFNADFGISFCYLIARFKLTNSFRQLDFVASDEFHGKFDSFCRTHVHYRLRLLLILMDEFKVESVVPKRQHNLKSNLGKVFS